jgi:hypothetical protein
MSRWGWGGWRPHAGRKPKDPTRPSQPHKTRPFAPRTPMQVTARAADGHPSLREKKILAAILADVRAVAPAARGRIRVTHYGVGAGHLHLVVEADERSDFIRGLQSLFIRLAKNINTALGRDRGQVFADRYLSRPITDVASAARDYALQVNERPPGTGRE